MAMRAFVLGPEFDHLEDDQGETLGNASYHQDAAMNVRECLRAYGKGLGLPWYASYQTPLAKHGQTFTPDVFVHTTRGSEPFDVLDVEHEGAPALIIEGLNPVTGLATDLNPSGKLGAYEAMGVAEYLTFDPIGELVPEQIRAWRLSPDGKYVSWEADAEWRWQSALGVSFAPQGLRLRVFDEAGRLIPDMEALHQRFNELGRERRQIERALQTEREIARLVAENARVRGER